MPTIVLMSAPLVEVEISSKAMEINALKTVIATISSKLLAINMIDGIPFFVPRFSYISLITDWRSTAGLTAPMQKPFA